MTSHKDIIERKNKNNGIGSYQEIETWLNTISENSGPRYLNALRRFCEFTSKNPSELIDIRDSKIKNDDHNNMTEIRDLILDFRTYLGKEGYARKTINAMDGAVRGFFTTNLGKVGMVNVKNYRDAQVSRKKDLIPTLEELTRILDVSNLEEKFRVIFLGSDWYENLRCSISKGRQYRQCYQGLLALSPRTP
ncbi:MAG: hypothetical protein QXU18_05580 [Thermoplasmatales archaeon]